MGKKRVYEIAREYNLSSKEALRVLEVLGFTVKSHMSSLDDDQINKFADHLRSLEEPEKEIKKSQEVKKEDAIIKEKPKKDVKVKIPEGKASTKPSKAKKERSKATKEDVIKVGPAINVAEFANLINVNVTEVIKKLMSLGIMANKNQDIDSDVAIIVGEEFGVSVKLDEEYDEKELDESEDTIEDPPEKLEERPPVVTVMGHVDHGKTSLLDAIRFTNVTEHEAGGITQRIGAYQVEKKEKKITFLDTPGHEAFTSMRARGAQATDIAVLVVSADDGVMPQTIEAINHAKSAGVPIIVAINKIDKPGANPEKVKQQLTEHGLVPEEWGGDNICVNVSAVQGEGIDNLLEMILLVAEVEELKANPDREAYGIVIESELDKGRGPVASVLVRKGTLKVGDCIVAGTNFGRVRAMINDKGKRVKFASPSTPVEVLGLSGVPQSGEIIKTFINEKDAKVMAEKRKELRRYDELKRSQRASLEDLFKQMSEEKLKELNIIIKADVHGSVEALRQSLEQINTDEVKVKVVHGGAGNITETDVMLAAASNSIIIGFNVRPDSKSRRAAEQEGVEIRLYRVIYEAIDDVKKAIEGLLEPEVKEKVLGKVEVRATFKIPKAGTIAGCYVLEGKITNSSNVRILRDGAVVYEGKVNSLKRFKDDVKEVFQGYECGVGIEKFNDIKEGDILEPYEMIEVKRELQL